MVFIHSLFHNYTENGIEINWYGNNTSLVNKAKKTIPSHYILWHFFWSNSTFGLLGCMPWLVIIVPLCVRNTYITSITILFPYIENIYLYDGSFFPKTLAIGYWIKFKEKQTRPRMVCNVWVTQKIKRRN